MCANFLASFLVTEQSKLLEWLDVVFGSVDEPVWKNPGVTKRGRVEQYPGYEIAVVTQDGDGKREWSEHTWGFVPPWADEPKPLKLTFNAVGETLAEKPMWKSSFKAKRCLIPANGFYDYETTPDGAKNRYLFSGDTSFIAMAGLWTSWKKGDEVRSATIVTTEPNSLVRQYHHRMPVILRHNDFGRWLDPKTPTAELQLLLIPYGGKLTATPAPKPPREPAAKKESVQKKLRGKTNTKSGKLL